MKPSAIIAALEESRQSLARRYRLYLVHERRPEQIRAFARNRVFEMRGAERLAMDLGVTAGEAIGIGDALQHEVYADRDVALAWLADVTL